jgi:hypothetical protein
MSISTLRWPVLSVLVSAFALGACSSGNGLAGGDAAAGVGSGGSGGVAGDSRGVDAGGGSGGLAGGSGGGAGGTGGAACDPAACDSLAATFSATGMNPVGVWSYGQSATLGGPFTLFATFYPGTNPTFTGLPCWASANLPDLCFNPGLAAVEPYGTYTVQPSQILAHPGQQGEYAIARWTAAQSGSYRICARFDGLSGYAGNPLTTTDVHVQHGGSDLSHGTINVQGGGNSFAVITTSSVAAGEAIDFAVGYGNGTFAFDSTGIDALVCKQ